MQKQTITVVWPDAYELNFPGETLKSLWRYLDIMKPFDPEDIDPVFFILEDGTKLKFDEKLLSQCYVEGKLTQNELLNLLEIKDYPKLKYAAKQISGLRLQ